MGNHPTHYSISRAPIDKAFAGRSLLRAPHVVLTAVALYRFACGSTAFCAPSIVGTSHCKAQASCVETNLTDGRHACRLLVEIWRGLRCGFEITDRLFLLLRATA